MQTNSFRITCLMVCLAIAIPVLALQRGGDPITGTWTGDWGPNAADRNTVGLYSGTVRSDHDLDCGRPVDGDVTKAASDQAAVARAGMFAPALTCVASSFGKPHLADFAWADGRHGAAHSRDRRRNVVP